MGYEQVGGGWNNGPNPFQSLVQKLNTRQDYHQQTLMANHAHANRMEEHAYLHQTAQERIHTQGRVDRDTATHAANLGRENFAATSAHESRMSTQESGQRMAESTHAAETLSKFSSGRQANRVSLPGGASVEFTAPAKKTAAKRTTAASKPTVNKAIPMPAADKPKTAKAPRKAAAKTPTKPTK